jgi:hypothetical protein
MLDNCGAGHAAALAHRLQPVPTAALFERINECCHDAGTASAEWVADGDGSAVDVCPSKHIIALHPIHVTGPSGRNADPPRDFDPTPPARQSAARNGTQVLQIWFG